MAKEIAIVLNNGSINSAVATALANQKYRPVVLHAAWTASTDDDESPSRARLAFDQQVVHFKPYREHVLSLPFESIVDSGQNRQLAQVQDSREQGPIAPTLIELLPLMAAAGRFAVHYQAMAVYVGLRVGGNVDAFAAATEYVQIWNEMLQLPCGATELEFSAPLLELEPWQVIDLGFQVSAPLDRTWTCQGNGPEPCGACKGCRDREAAFQQAGKPDPMKVSSKSEARR